MKRLLVLTALLGCVASPAFAQTAPAKLAEQLAAIDPKKVTPAECDAAIAAAQTSNAAALFYGMAVCMHAGKQVEGSFLLNAGQTRALADMVTMVPAAKADSDVTIDLYGFIYAYAGGPGSDEVLRDPKLRARFLQLLDGWTPVIDASYDPGWKTRRRSDAPAYLAAVADIKASRRKQLDDITRVYSDEQYYALQREFNALQVRTAGRYEEGTPNQKLADSLQKRMRARAKAIGVASFAAEPGIPSGKPSASDYPPPAPGSDETIVATATDASTQRCADIAERMAIGGDQKIDQILVSKSAKWGLIWRADLSGGKGGAERFTCADGATSSRPLAMGSDVLATLPK